MGWMPCTPESFAARVDRTLSGRCVALANLAQVLWECGGCEPAVTHQPGHQRQGQSATRGRPRAVLRYAVPPRDRAEIHQDMWWLPAQIKEGKLWLEKSTGVFQALRTASGDVIHDLSRTSQEAGAYFRQVFAVPTHFLRGASRPFASRAERIPGLGDWPQQVCHRG